MILLYDNIGLLIVGGYLTIKIITKIFENKIKTAGSFHSPPLKAFIVNNAINYLTNAITVSLETVGSTDIITLSDVIATMEKINSLRAHTRSSFSVLKPEIAMPSHHKLTAAPTIRYL
ncbi:protoheme IX farnesyltransferase [Providencia rustigianii]